MKNFEYDKSRVINFSDAVFSIAMTLLVLEIAIPSARQVKTDGTWSVLSNLIPNFVGFLVSFFVIALYWIAHLRLMKYVSSIPSKLLWLNILLLLFVVLLPFSTAFYSGGFVHTGPFVFYSLNLAIIGIFNYLMIRYVSKKEGVALGLDTITAKWLKWRALNVVYVWIFAAICAFTFFWVSRFAFVLIFIIQPFIDRRYRKKLNS
ncbi:TMEM175 family protein [Sungkyunkwania multivorans]|uniref:TMEM175 family protein n=1 Tax=Sungkyunkwania multivorans TaxID=1173618 RepID=A0ABW3CW70_9FLAO